MPEPSYHRRPLADAAGADVRGALGARLTVREAAPRRREGAGWRGSRVPRSHAEGGRREASPAVPRHGRRRDRARRSPLGHRRRGGRLRPTPAPSTARAPSAPGRLCHGGRQARGDLDRRRRQGPDPGALPRRRHARRTQTLSKYLHTVDNQPGARRRCDHPGHRALDAQCDDVDPTVGTQTTRTSITFTASVNQGVNVSRLLGRDIGAGERPPRLQAPRGSRCRSGQRRRPLRGHHGGQGPLGPLTGAARTDNGPGPEAACLLWGTAFRVG